MVSASSDMVTIQIFVFRTSYKNERQSYRSFVDHSFPQMLIDMSFFTDPHRTIP